MKSDNRVMTGSTSNTNNLEGYSIEDLHRLPPKEVRIAVAMSGSIASTATAYLLKKQGHQVIGVGMSFLDPQTRSRLTSNSANSSNNANVLEEGSSAHKNCIETDLSQIKSVCSKLDIPFYAVNAQEEFESLVLDPLCTARLSGEDFNPCLWCSNVKMQLLYEKLKSLNAHFMAAGYFAKIHKNLMTGLYQIHVANDMNYDQSFFLGKLDQQYLRKLILPLGDLSMSDVLKITDSLNMKRPVEQKENTNKQWCFMTHAEMVKMVESKAHEGLRDTGHYINITNNYHMGENKGLHYHQVGSDQLYPLFATTHLEKNLVVINMESAFKRVNLGPREILELKKYCIENIQFNGPTDISTPRDVFVQISSDNIRYAAKLYPSNNDAGILEFEKKVFGLCKGKYIALYSDNSKNAYLLGSAICGRLRDLSLLSRIDDFEINEKFYEVDDEGNKIAPRPKEFQF